MSLLRAAPGVGLALAAYAVWLLAAAVSALVVPLFRTVAVRLVVALGLGPWPLGFIDKFGIIVVVGAWLVWVVASEGRLVRAARDSFARLVREGGIVLGVSAGATACLAALVQGLTWAAR